MEDFNEGHQKKRQNCQKKPKQLYTEDFMDKLSYFTCYTVK